LIIDPNIGIQKITTIHNAIGVLFTSFLKVIIIELIIRIAYKENKKIKNGELLLNIVIWVYFFNWLIIIHLRLVCFWAHQDFIFFLTLKTLKTDTEKVTP